MNDEEARFFLRAYRPDGRDATDPRFADALAQAEFNPELRAWLERERTLDTAVSDKLNAIPPPADLRDTILAGGRASQPRRVWWANPLWLAAAAGSVALVSSLAMRFRSSKTDMPSAEAFVAFAMDDLAFGQNEHVVRPPLLAGLQADLAHSTTPLPGHLELNLAELKQKSCRTASFAGREVFEICFARDGRSYHLYAARKSDFAAGTADSRGLTITKGSFAATAWKDAHNIYALVTSAGQDVVRHLV